MFDFCWLRLAATFTHGLSACSGFVVVAWDCFFPVKYFQLVMAFTMLRPISTHPFSYPADLTLMSDDEEGNRSESDGSTDQGYGCYGTPEGSYRRESGGVVRQRNAANARERYRTQNVNTAFTALRTLIPTEPVDRKRLASSYISHLANVLVVGDGTEDGQPCLSAVYKELKGRGEGRQPRTICTFCLSNQRKGVRKPSQ